MYYCIIGRSLFLDSRFLSYVIVGASMRYCNLLFILCRSYQPDLPWDKDIVGYDRALLHWMFRQALQSFLFKKLQPLDFDLVCNVLRKQFNDPDFGFPPKPSPPRDLREILTRDPCDCIIPLPEQLGEEEQLSSEHEMQVKGCTFPFCKLNNIKKMTLFNNFAIFQFM